MFCKLYLPTATDTESTIHTSHRDLSGSQSQSSPVLLHQLCHGLLLTSSIVPYHIPSVGGRSSWWTHMRCHPRDTRGAFLRNPSNETQISMWLDLLVILPFCPHCSCNCVDVYSRLLIRLSFQPYHHQQHPPIHQWQQQQPQWLRKELEWYERVVVHTVQSGDDDDDVDEFTGSWPAQWGQRFVGGVGLWMHLRICLVAAAYLPRRRMN